MRLSTIAFILSLAVAAEGIDTCEPDTWNHYGELDYLVSSQALNWEQAECACVAAGGYLARPETPEQLTILRELAACIGTEIWFWIGASDLEERWVWRWTDGSLVPEDVPEWFDGNSVDPPEPGDGDNDTLWNCVNLERWFSLDEETVKSSDYYWHNFDCNQPERYFCQREGNPECPRDAWISRGCIEYYYVTGTAAWSDAKEYCECELGAHLIRPNTQQEMDSLMDIVRCTGDRFYDIWLGATDRIVPGVWTWDDGTKIPEAMMNWYGKRPEAHCAKVGETSRQWYQNWCDGSVAYMCQRTADECKTNESVVGGGDESSSSMCCRESSSSSSSSSSMCCSENSSSSSSSSMCCSENSSSSSSASIKQK